MKYSYVIIPLLVIAWHTNCCYHSSSKSSYSKDSSSSSARTISQSSHQVKQQETTAQKLRSFAYSNQLFSQLDRSSAQLVNTVAQKLQTAPNAHDYALYLGIFNALAITACAQQKPSSMSQTLTAAYQNHQIQQQQADTIRNALDTTFSERNNSTACKQAQAMSNALVRIVGGFVEQMPPVGPHTDLELSIGAANACQLPGLPQIKEFVAKFGQLSTQGKKNVGKMLLAGNISEALKLISVGEKRIYNYDRYHHSIVIETERKPFVENPKAGMWFSACISNDLILSKGAHKYYYLIHRARWHKDSKCPFNVVAHGNPSEILVQTQDINPQGLNNVKLQQLQSKGEVTLNPKETARLLKTDPNYKGEPINLFSCECGKDDEGFAQQLADEMEVSVSAFTGLATMIGVVAFASLTADDDGSDIKSRSSVFGQYEEIKTFYPKKKQITNIPSLQLP